MGASSLFIISKARAALRIYELWLFYEPNILILGITPLFYFVDTRSLVLIRTFIYNELGSVRKHIIFKSVIALAFNSIISYITILSTASLSLASLTVTPVFFGSRDSRSCWSSSEKCNEFENSRKLHLTFWKDIVCCLLD